MNVFVTGGTGYIGSGLIPLLASRGHQAKALVRPGSEKKLPPGALGIPGDALRIDSYTNDVRGSDTFVHLIGTPHPSPARAQQFRDVDLVSVRVAIRSASEAGIRQFVYLSVAQPSAQRLGLVTIKQILNAVVWAIENPPAGIRVIDVPRIRELSRLSPICRRE
jgi:uncharacterized protein YbjT (DUF2867 family)